MYVPFNMLKTSFGTNDYSNVSVQTESADQIKSTGKEAARLLNDNHGTKEAYQVMNMEEIAAGIGQVTTVMTTIIGSIAGISLVVGGIGVMNIMLVSVTERTREIGIRKSLGATRGQILTQFLIESVVLTLIGGLIGICLGYGSITRFPYRRLAVARFLAGGLYRCAVQYADRCHFRHAARQQSISLRSD